MYWSGAVIVPEKMEAQLQGMTPSRQIEAFDLTPQISIDNNLSDKATVIEVSGARPPGVVICAGAAIV